MKNNFKQIWIIFIFFVNYSIQSCPEEKIEGKTKCFSISELLYSQYISPEELSLVYNNYKNKVNYFKNFGFQILYSTQVSSTFSTSTNNITQVNIQNSCLSNITNEFYIMKFDFFLNSYMNLLNYSLYDINGNKINYINCQLKLFSIFHKINLSKIDLNISMIVQFKELKGIDIFNINDKFFYDVCFKFTSNAGTDIPISTRVKYIYQNVSFCNYSDGIYLSFEYENQELYIECGYGIYDRTFTKPYLYELDKNLTSITKYSNMKVLGCYDLVFDITFKNFFTNLGSFFIFFIFLLEISLVILYIYFGTKPLYDKIKLFFKEEGINISEMDKCHKTNVELIYLNEDKTSIENKINNIQIYENRSTIETSNNINYEYIDRQNKKLFHADYEEINEFSFSDALKYDKRTFKEYFWDKLKIDQNFIFTFINNDDYNLLVCKLILFFFRIPMILNFNAFFYSDNTMETYYETSGAFNLVLSLRRSIVSSIVTGIIIVIFKCFVFSNSGIRNVRNSKTYTEAYKSMKCYLRYFKIRFIFILVIMFVFILFFWYYVRAFCAAYENTQWKLFGDILFSLIITHSVPFVLALLCGIFRIYSLKKQIKCMYIFSKIIQIF